MRDSSEHKYFILPPWLVGQRTDEGEREGNMTGVFGLSEWILLPFRRQDKRKELVREEGHLICRRACQFSLSNSSFTVLVIQVETNCIIFSHFQKFLVFSSQQMAVSLLFSTLFSVITDYYCYHLNYISSWFFAVY